MFQEELEDQPSNVKALAGALSFFSVGLALGVAYVVGILIQGTAAWPVSAFLTTIVYVAAVGVELAFAHRICGVVSNQSAKAGCLLPVFSETRLPV